MILINNNLEDRTIAAIATPPGKGAIAIIRVSGKDSQAIVSQIFSKNLENLPSHTVHVGHIQDPSDGKIIDQVLIITMLAPKTFTGENSVEIHCHGSQLIAKKILDLLIQSGARLANPGEFSLRAFLNKKIDLSQAEAIQEMIQAENEMALQAAKDQLLGHLSEKITAFQKTILDTLSLLEAWLDFPDEELPKVSYEELENNLFTLAKEMQKLSDSYFFGQKIKTGISLCLAGAPNVGKSSLLNLLLKKDRAIVTEIPGTTRDLIEEDLIYKNLHFKMIDTAGIRETEELIEKEGIKRSKNAISEADLILLLFDASLPFSKEDETLLHLCPKEKTLYILNKIDLCSKSFSKKMDSSIPISIKQKIGIETLMEKIFARIEENYPKDKNEMILTQKRHKAALDQAIHYIQESLKGLKENRSFEFISLDLRSSLLELSLILGSDPTEELLNSIFSQFCIGK